LDLSLVTSAGFSGVDEFEKYVKESLYDLATKDLTEDQLAAYEVRLRLLYAGVREPTERQIEMVGTRVRFNWAGNDRKAKEKT